MATPTSTQFAVAVHVLTYLSAVGAADPISSDELSESINASPVYIRRVLTPLRESGLVASRSGPHGGWTLVRPAASISLAQVWRLLQGENHVLGIHGPNPSCPVGVDVQRTLLAIDRAVADAVAATLAGWTVADVTDQTWPARHRPR